MKKAIVLISFGTTHLDASKKSIKKLADTFKDSFPNYDIFQAYTSKIVRKRLKEQKNIEILSPGDQLERLVDESYEEIYIQPTHIIPGKEYKKIFMHLKRLRDTDVKVKVAQPLLTDLQSFEEVIEYLNNKHENLKDNEAVFYMAHGTADSAFTSYVTLDYMLEETAIYVSCVEGYPPIEKNIKKMKEDGIEKIELRPFMLVAGDHAVNDMTGSDPDSWESILRSAGFEVKTVVEGIGEDENIRQMYVNRFQKWLNKPSRCKHAK